MDTSSKCEELDLGSVSGVEPLNSATGESSTQKKLPHTGSAQKSRTILPSPRRKVYTYDSVGRSIIGYTGETHSFLSHSLPGRLVGDRYVESAFSPLSASGSSMSKLEMNAEYSRPKGSGTRIQLFKESESDETGKLEILPHEDVPGPFVKGFLESPPVSKDLIRPRAIGGSSNQQRMGASGTGYFNKELFSPLSNDNDHGNGDPEQITTEFKEKRRLSFDSDDCEGSESKEIEAYVSQDVHLDARDDGIPGAEDQSSDSSDSDNRSVVEVTSQSGPDNSMNSVDQLDDTSIDQSDIVDEGQQDRNCEENPLLIEKLQEHPEVSSDVHNNEKEGRKENDGQYEQISPVEKSPTDIALENNDFHSSFQQHHDLENGENKENAPPPTNTELDNICNHDNVGDHNHEHFGQFQQQAWQQPLSSTPNAKQYSSLPNHLNVEHNSALGNKESKEAHVNNKLELGPPQIPRPSTSPGGQNGMSTSSLAIAGIAKDRRQPRLGVRAQQMNIREPAYEQHVSQTNMPNIKISSQQREECNQETDPVSIKSRNTFIPQKYLQGLQGDSEKNIYQARQTGQSLHSHYNQGNVQHIQHVASFEHKMQGQNFGHINKFGQYVSSNAALTQPSSHPTTTLNGGINQPMQQWTSHPGMDRAKSIDSSPQNMHQDLSSLASADVDIRSMENVREQLHHMLTLSNQALPDKKQYDQVTSEDFGNRFPVLQDQNAGNSSFDSTSTTDIYQTKGGHMVPYDSMLSYASGILRSDATELLSQKRDGSASALYQELKLSRDSLEQERYRRKHCEKQIQELQAKILELQQQLAIAVSTDKKKDSMIEQLDKALAKVVSGWKKKDNETQEILTRLQQENSELQHKSVAQQELLHKFEMEMAAVIEELTTEQQKITWLKQEKEKLVAAAEEEAAENMRLLENEHRQLQSLQAEHSSVQEAYQGLKEQLNEVSQELENEREAWEEKEQDYLQKIDEITENHLSAIGQERDKTDRLSQTVEDTQTVLSAAQTEVQDLQIKLDTACRERERMKVEMGLLEARAESSQRKLEAELRADSERQLSERLEEAHNRQMSAEEEMRERHRKQIIELNSRHSQEMEEQLHQFHKDLQKRDDKMKKQTQEYEEKLDSNREELDTLKRSNKKLESQRLEMTSKLQATMQSHCNDVLRLLQGGTITSLGLRDSAFTSVYTTSPIRPSVTSQHGSIKSAASSVVAPSAISTVASSVPSLSSQAHPVISQKINAVNLDAENYRKDSSSAASGEPSQQSFEEEQEKTLLRSKSPTDLPANVTLTSDVHHVDPHNVSNLSGAFISYSGLATSVGLPQGYGGPLESTHLSTLTPPKTGVPSLSSVNSGISTSVAPTHESTSTYSSTLQPQEPQVNYGALVQGLHQYRQNFQPNASTSQVTEYANQLLYNHSGSIPTSQTSYESGTKPFSHHEELPSNFSLPYVNPPNHPTSSSADFFTRPTMASRLPELSTGIYPQQWSTGIPSISASQNSNTYSSLQMAAPTDRIASYRVSSSLPGYGGHLSSGSAMPPGGNLENQVTRDVASSRSGSGTQQLPHIQHAQMEPHFLESLIHQADQSVQKFSGFNHNVSSNQSYMSSEDGFSALHPDTTIGSTHGMESSTAWGQPSAVSNHGNTTSLSMGPLDHNSVLNTSETSQAESGTNSADYSRISDRFQEHETRQSELQHYIKMLLSKNAGSPAEEEKEPVKDQGGSPRLHGQPVHVEQIPVTPPQKVRHVAFSQPEIASQNKQSNVPAGILSPQQVGEISRLLGMYKGGATGAESDPSQPPVQELLAYLRDLKPGQEEDTENSPPTPPTMKAKPQASTPTKQTNAGKARRSLSSTYQISEDKSSHAVGKPSSPPSKHKGPKSSAGKAGQHSKKPERKVAKTGKFWK